MLIGNQIYNFLKRTGVEHIYGMPADSVNGLYDYIGCFKGARVHQVYNEKVGASAALCTSLLSNTASAVIGTAGPGIAHFKQAMIYAQENKIPIVFFVGLPDSGSAQFSFQDILIDKISAAIGIPFYDVRTNVSSMDEINYADLPCVIGIDKAMFMDTIYLDVGGDDLSCEDKKDKYYVHKNKDSIYLSESMRSRNDRDKNDFFIATGASKRPSGWGAGIVVALAALKMKSRKCLMHVNDFLESVSDVIKYMNDASVELTVFCENTSETKRLRNIFNKTKIVGKAYGKASILFTDLSFLPDNLEIVKNTAKVRVYDEKTEIDLEHSTIEALSLSGAAFARLGYKVVFEANDIFDFLALSNGVYDLYMDELKAEVRIKNNRTENDFEKFFPALNPLYAQEVKSAVPIDLLEEFNNKLSNSKKPIFILGSQSIKYAQDFILLSTKHKIPIATTMGSYSAYKHAPYFIGMIGSAGSFQAEKIRSSADMLIYVGVTNRGLAHGVFYCNSFCWDINSSKNILFSRPEQNKQINLGIGEFLTYFKPFCCTRSTSWMKKIRRAKLHALEPRKYLSEYLSGRRISSRNAIRHALRSFSPKDTIIFVDVGLHTLWAARTIPAEYEVVWTRNFATMGVATVSGIKTAKYINKNIMVITGDGGFSLVVGEVFKEKVNVIKSLNILVINNNGLGAVKYEQEVCGWKSNNYEYPLLGSKILECSSDKKFHTLTRSEELSSLKNIFKTSTFNIVNLLVDPYEAPVPSRDIDKTARLRLLRVWVKSGFTGLYTAFRTIPYIIDKWKAR